MKLVAIAGGAIVLHQLAASVVLKGFVTVAAGGAGSSAAGVMVMKPSISVGALNDIPAALLALFIVEAHRCQGLHRTVIAGIRKVESDHGRYGGNTIGPDGTARPPIMGIPLDGDGGTVALAETDDGQWDGDPTWDRAVGPLQFIPSSWRISVADLRYLCQLAGRRSLLVGARTLVGLSGSTTGPQLHLGITVDGTVVCPQQRLLASRRLTPISPSVAAVVGCMSGDVGIDWSWLDFVVCSSDEAER